VVDVLVEVGSADEELLEDAMVVDETTLEVDEFERLEEPASEDDVEIEVEDVWLVDETALELDEFEMFDELVSDGVEIVDEEVEVTEA
jgi:hypothetical protein